MLSRDCDSAKKVQTRRKRLSNNGNYPVTVHVGAKAGPGNVEECKDQDGTKVGDTANSKGFRVEEHLDQHEHKWESVHLDVKPEWDATTD